jgi:hypothetical protein
LTDQLPDQLPPPADTRPTTTREKKRKEELPKGKRLPIGSGSCISRKKKIGRGNSAFSSSSASQSTQNTRLLILLLFLEFNTSLTRLREHKRRENEEQEQEKNKNRRRKGSWTPWPVARGRWKAPENGKGGGPVLALFLTPWMAHWRLLGGPLSNFELS